MSWCYFKDEPLTVEELEKNERRKERELKRKQLRVLFAPISVCIAMLGLLVMVMPLPALWPALGVILFFVGGISAVIIGGDVALYYEEKYANIW